MKKELCIKTIYDDFLSKVVLTNLEKEVLDLYIQNISIIKIADITTQSTSTISRIISEIKNKYETYRKLELSKLEVFMM